jgi:hypothetical protein
MPFRLRCCQGCCGAVMQPSSSTAMSATATGCARHGMRLAACDKQMRDGFNRLDETLGPDMAA